MCLKYCHIFFVPKQRLNIVGSYHTFMHVIRMLLLFNSPPNSFWIKLLIRSDPLSQLELTTSSLSLDVAPISIGMLSSIIFTYVKFHFVTCSIWIWMWSDATAFRPHMQFIINVFDLYICALVAHRISQSAICLSHSICTRECIKLITLMEFNRENCNYLWFAISGVIS